MTEHIWEGFHEKLLGFINSKVGNNEIAKDILQDVFIKIHQKRDTLQDETKITNWVYQITRNTIIDYYRKRKVIEPFIAEEALPMDHSTQEIDFSACLKPFIRKLSQKDQELLNAVSFGNISQKDYAVNYDIPYSTIKSRVQRAKEKLKNSFIECCAIELDSYGNVLSHDKKNCKC